jgi:hypothetical protein
MVKTINLKMCISKDNLIKQFRKKSIYDKILKVLEESYSNTTALKRVFHFPVIIEYIFKGSLMQIVIWFSGTKCSTKCRNSCFARQHVHRPHPRHRHCPDPQYGSRASTVRHQWCAGLASGSTNPIPCQCSISSGPVYYSGDPRPAHNAAGVAAGPAGPDEVARGSGGDRPGLGSCTCCHPSDDAGDIGSQFGNSHRAAGDNSTRKKW